MLLLICKECGKPVTTDSRFCPHCGKNGFAKQGKKNRGLVAFFKGLMAFFAFVALVVLLVMLMSPNSSQHDSPVSATTQATRDTIQPTPDTTVTAEPQRTAPPDNGIKMYYTIMPAPCAVDRSTIGTMAGVISDRDAEGLQGLEESGKVLILAEGTKFEGLPFPDGLILGYARSGRHIGKECYMLQELLQTSRPRK
jgi:predicted nucleic acid-binding Zn ribbon protein